jgi:hypothetical protein
MFGSRKEKGDEMVVSWIVGLDCWVGCGGSFLHRFFSHRLLGFAFGVQ